MAIHNFRFSIGAPKQKKCCNFYFPYGSHSHLALPSLLLSFSIFVGLAFLFLNCFILPCLALFCNGIEWSYNANIFKMLKEGTIQA